MNKTKEDILKVIDQLEMKPFGLSVANLENGDLALLLKELVNHRETIESLRELII